MSNNTYRKKMKYKERPQESPGEFYGVLDLSIVADAKITRKVRDAINKALAGNNDE